MKEIKMTEEEALEKIKEREEYIEKQKKAKGAGIIIYNRDGDELFQSDKQTIKEAIESANLSGANLSGAKFFGKGSAKVIKKSQVKDFLAALGFVVEQ